MVASNASMVTPKQIPGSNAESKDGAKGIKIGLQKEQDHKTKCIFKLWNLEYNMFSNFAHKLPNDWTKFCLYNYDVLWKHLGKNWATKSKVIVFQHKIEINQDRFKSKLPNT